MLKLEITGANVNELYVNGVNTLLLLTRGGQEMFKPAPTAETATPPIVEPLAEPAKTQETPPVEPAPAKPELKPRGKKAEPKTIDLPKSEYKEVVDEDPLGLGIKPSAPADAEKALTLDDMRQRVKDIVAAHNKRGNEMPVCVAYVRKLFEPYGIKLAAELKSEQFAEFWSASAAYLDGTAK